MALQNPDGTWNTPSGQPPLNLQDQIDAYQADLSGSYGVSQPAAGDALKQLLNLGGTAPANPMYGTPNASGGITEQPLPPMPPAATTTTPGSTLNAGLNAQTSTDQNAGTGIRSGYSTPVVNGVNGATLSPPPAPASGPTFGTNPTSSLSGNDYNSSISAMMGGTPAKATTPDPNLSQTASAASTAGTSSVPTPGSNNPAPPAASDSKVALPRAVNNRNDGASPTDPNPTGADSTNAGASPISSVEANRTPAFGTTPTAGITPTNYNSAVGAMMSGGQQNQYQGTATPGPTQGPLSTLTSTPPAITGTPGAGTSGGAATTKPPATTTTPPAPTNSNSVPPKTFGTNTPLNFHGNTDPMYQANTMVSWLKSIGIQVPAFSVGGSSQYDPAINSLINQINGTNDPNLQKSLAQQLVNYMGLRTNATGATFQYDPTTGSFLPPQGTPGGSTANQLVGNLPSTTNPGNVSFNSPQTAADRQQFQDMLKQLTDPSVLEQGAQVQKNQLQNDLANRLSTQKTQMSEQEGGQGVQGGVLQSQLLGLQNSANADFASGESGIESTLLQQEQAAKQAGLSAVLQQSGLDQQSAEQLATLLVGSQEQQASLASSNQNTATSLAQSGAYNTASLGLQGRQQTINEIISLYQLAAQGDTAAGQQAFNLLQTLGTQ